MTKAFSELAASSSPTDRKILNALRNIPGQEPYRYGLNEFGIFPGWVEAALMFFVIAAGYMSFVFCDIKVCLGPVHRLTLGRSWYRCFCDLHGSTQLAASR